jgi:fatty-acyl-CoA synthase
VIRFANLIDALEAAPAERSFITSWIDEDEKESVTFGEFRGRVQAEATALGKSGLRSGDRVVIIMPQGIPGMTTFVAAMMIGAVPAFLAYPNFKVEPAKYRSGLEGVTANLSAKAVVIDAEFPEEMLSSVSLGGASLIRAGIHISSDDSELQQPGALGSSPNLEANSLAFIQHSAGTTGLQKGVALNHGAVLRQLEHLSQTLKINGEKDRIYSWLPLYHDMGLIACFMLPMVCHVPLVMQSPLDWVMHPESMLQIVSEHKCTLAWMPNFAFQFVPRRTPKNRWAAYDLSSLRLLINCSEPVRASSITEFQTAFAIQSGVVQSCYAMAENVFAVTQSDIARDPVTIYADGQQFRSAHRISYVDKETKGAVAFTSSGRLLPEQQVRIVGEVDAILPDDQIGEIVVKGDCLFEGYYNRSELTAQVFKGGWYHTGDLGFYQQGELFVVGRKKDLLIVGGENIYPQDIEQIVGAHSAVHDGRVVAMGLYNPELGTEDIVVVAELENEELLANAVAVESEIRANVVAALGIAVRTIVLKPPKWIVKSTAGKAARSATREKMLREHPELNAAAQISA